MGYDFPGTPNLGQVFTPAIPDAPSYIWNGYAWQRYGETGGISEAPGDGQQYGRQLSDWTPITAGDWNTIVNKPLTFPPTLPIPISGVTNLTTSLQARQNISQKGIAGGYCPLDTSALVPTIHLPSYVDDVLEFANLAAFPVTGAAGKIYVALDTNKTYRWSGSIYVEMPASAGSTDAVPEGSVNLYFTTTRAADAAPVQTVAGRIGEVVLAKADISGIENVDNTSDLTKPISTATQTALNLKLSDAPSDSSFYARRNAAWEVVSTGAAAGIPEAPNTVGQVFARSGATTSWIRSVDWTTHSALDTRVGAVEVLNTTQTTRLDGIDTLNTTQNTRLTAIEGVNTTQQTSITNKVSKTGDSMTGALSLKVANIGLGLGVPVAGEAGRLQFFDATGAVISYITGNLTTKVMSFTGLSGWVWNIPATVDWSAITGKPATFPPDTTGLQTLITPGTITQYYRGDKTWQTLDKIAVGLTNVDNTADLDKPLSTAMTDALNLRVPIGGGVMTGPLVVNEELTIAGGDPTVDPTTNTAILGARDDGGLDVWWNNGLRLLEFLPSGVIDFPATPTVNGSPISGGGGGSGLPLTGGTLTGPLGISQSAEHSYITFNRTDTAYNVGLYSAVNTNLRWAYNYGSNDAESGGNVGSNIYLYRYGDAGDFLGRIYSINRQSGVFDFELMPTLNGAPIATGTTTISTSAPSGGVDGDIWYKV